MINVVIFPLQLAAFSQEQIGGINRILPQGYGVSLAATRLAIWPVGCEKQLDLVSGSR